MKIKNSPKFRFLAKNSFIKMSKSKNGKIGEIQKIK